MNQLLTDFVNDDYLIIYTGPTIATAILIDDMEPGVF